MKKFLLGCILAGLLITPAVAVNIPHDDKSAGDTIKSSEWNAALGAGETAMTNLENGRVKIDGSTAITGDQTFNQKVTITGVLDANSTADFSSTVDIHGVLDMNSQKVTNVAACTAGGDAVNKTYFDANAISYTLANNLNFNGKEGTNCIELNVSRLDAYSTSRIEVQDDMDMNYENLYFASATSSGYPYISGAGGRLDMNVKNLGAGASVYQFNVAGSTKMSLRGNGDLRIDGTYQTFSPKIGKKNPTARDYLDWVLKDAKKPAKPYKGLPRLKEFKEDIGENVFNTQIEVDTETEKYAKDISKIAIGTARWAEEAQKEIKNNEEAIQNLQGKFNGLITILLASGLGLTGLKGLKIIKKKKV